MAAASAGVTDVSGGFTIISIERLRALEALEAEMPARIAAAIADAAKKRLDALNSKKKENPKATAEKSLKKYYENKESINARRRELYRLKKEGLAGKIPGDSLGGVKTISPDPSKE